MTSMHVCPKHEEAYPAGGCCKWCEPAPARSAPVSAGGEISVEYAGAGRFEVSMPRTMFTRLTAPCIEETYGPSMTAGVRRTLLGLSDDVLSGGAIDTLAELQATLDKAIYERLTASCLSHEQMLERLVADELRYQGASEKEIAEVLADKSRFSVDAEGRVVVRLPGRIECVGLSVSFEL
jgi:hypothetical protein